MLKQQHIRSKGSLTLLRERLVTYCRHIQQHTICASRRTNVYIYAVSISLRSLYAIAIMHFVSIGRNCKVLSIQSLSKLDTVWCDKSKAVTTAIGDKSSAAKTSLSLISSDEAKPACCSWSWWLCHKVSTYDRLDWHVTRSSMDGGSCVLRSEVDRCICDHIFLHHSSYLCWTVVHTWWTRHQLLRWVSYYKRALIK